VYALIIMGGSDGSVGDSCGMIGVSADPGTKFVVQTNRYFSLSIGKVQ
jgi:hypothetical protein